MYNHLYITSTLLVILSTLIIKTINFQYTCQFGSLYNNQKQQAYIPPGKTFTQKFDFDTKSQQSQYIFKSRRLAGITRDPLRITLDTTYTSTIIAPSNGANTTTASQLSFIVKAMNVAKRFYQLRLKVSPVARVYAPNPTCVDFNVPSSDISPGIGNSDLHIYVRYVSDGAITYGATAKSCNYVTGNNFPDTTFSQGRPTIGRIIFNTYTIFKNQSALTSRLFASTVATALHETLHVLGFDASLYSDYIDSRSGANYARVYNDAVTGTGPITSTATLHVSRSASYLINTPNVLAWAKDYFDCASMTGMQLQNQDGGTPGSHWQRISMYDQLMTGTSIGAQKGFSGLSFALLKDMGWYQVDGTFNDTTNYGYKKGCTFYNNGCYGTSYPTYFCDATALSGVLKCTTNFLGKAICSNQPALLADGCGIFASYYNCVDPAQVGDGYQSLSLQNYATDSFCVESTFSSYPLSSNLLSRCYKYVCHSGNTSITFTISSYIIQCQSSQAGTNKTLGGLQGYLTCPNYDDFCIQSRKICKNWCSQNGFCTRGICNCLSGYSGQDCSITSCTTSQFYDPGSMSCVPSCPSGTYENIYSRTCMNCQAGVCGQCRDQPQICTGCPPSTPPKVFYQSSCIDTCPSSTYQDTNNQCIDCDAAAFCGTCDFAATNCTSCIGGKYLSTPNFGTCGSTCGGLYPKYDTVNYKCVTSCTYNLIDGGSNQCVLCSYGTYKLPSDGLCHASCGSGYFQDTVNRYCQQCDITCDTCDGGYPQNCTKCKTGTTQKYLLLKMCLTKCPRGFYANDNTGACQICPVNLYCYTCEINGLNPRCLSCKYGYYFKSDYTCSTTCDTYQFKNQWNHTCDPCSLDCGQCYNANQTSCKDCRNPLKFLSNITGGYCLANCPAQGYVTIGDNCQECHHTCLTCNGVGASDCFQCKAGLYKSSGYCRYVCPQRSYPNKTTKSCQSCNSSCTFCFGPTINQCVKCINGMFLNNNTCTATCPPDLPSNKWKVCYEKITITKNIFVFIVLVVLGILIS